MTDETTEQASSLITIPEYSATAAAIALLTQRHSGVVFDCTKSKELDKAKEARAEIRSYRTALERKRVEIKAPALKRAREIDSEAKRITDQLLALEEPIDAQIKAEETRKEAARQEKLRIEQERLARQQQVLDDLAVMPAEAIGKGLPELQRLIARAQAVSFDGFDEAAAAKGAIVKAAAVAKLETLADMERQREEERAAAAQAAAEAEQRRQAEQAERDAQAAREREESQARAEAERQEREAAEARRREEDAARRRALDEEAAKLKAEREALERRAAAQAMISTIRLIPAECSRRASTVDDLQQTLTALNELPAVPEEFTQDYDQAIAEARAQVEALLAAAQEREHEEQRRAEEAQAERERQARAERERRDAEAAAEHEARMADLLANTPGLPAAAQAALVLLRESGLEDHDTTHKLAFALAIKAQEPSAAHWRKAYSDAVDSCRDPAGAPAAYEFERWARNLAENGELFTTERNSNG